MVTGFLLTAIPNWTGRLPIQGMPLLILVAVWLAGRVAVTFSAEIGWLPAAIVDVGFLALVVAAAAREIVAGKNWRNLRVVGLVTLLLAGNIAFHLEAHINGGAEYGARIGIAAVVLLLVVIGGRIIPSFTRNWLARENPGRLPAPFARCLRAIARSGTAIESSMISSAGNGWFGLPLSSRCHTGSPSGNAGASSFGFATACHGRCCQQALRLDSLGRPGGLLTATTPTAPTCRRGCNAAVTP